MASTHVIIYAVIKAGLLAGSLDIIIALIHYYLKTGKNPLLVLKYIASAVYGKEAFGGGTSMAAMGLAFHFVIAFGWTIFFFILYPVISPAARNKITTRLLYGVFYLACNEPGIIAHHKCSKIFF